MLEVAAQYLMETADVVVDTDCLCPLYYPHPRVGATDAVSLSENRQFPEPHPCHLLACEDADDGGDDDDDDGSFQETAAAQPPPQSSDTEKYRFHHANVALRIAEIERQVTASSTAQQQPHAIATTASTSSSNGSQSCLQETTSGSTPDDGVSLTRTRTSTKHKTPTSSYRENTNSRASALLPAVSSEEGPEEEKQCPICGDNLSKSDRLYPITCPEPSCGYNYCASCVLSMWEASQCPPEQASDGSHQVKVRVACPWCRSKYRNSQHQTNELVAAILQLRMAHSMESTIRSNENSELQKQEEQLHHFVRSTTLLELQEASHCLQQYRFEIDPTGTTKAVPSLDWGCWEKLLDLQPPPSSGAPSSFRGESAISSAPCSSSVETQKTSLVKVSDVYYRQNDNLEKPRYALQDPTLLQGLEEFVTPTETAFVTELFVSGDANKLAQAAHILQGIRPESTNSNTSSSFPVHMRATPWSRRAAQDVHKLRQRFPLPRRMPRCVRWPVYNPDQEDPAPANSLACKLVNSKKDGNVNTMALANVRGLLGQLGLRKGDVLTHCQGQPVDSPQELYDVMKRAYQRTLLDISSVAEEETVLIVVNGNEETARSLKERASALKDAGALQLTALH